MNSLSSALSARTGLNVMSDLANSQLGRFLAIGVAGLGVDMSVFTLLHNEGLSAAAARAFSIGAATLITWTLNRRYTFPSTGRRKRIEIVRYASVVVLSQGLSYATFLTLCEILPHLPPVSSLIIGAVAATAFSFGGQRLFTFAASAQRNVP